MEWKEERRLQGSMTTHAARSCRWARPQVRRLPPPTRRGYDRRRRSGALFERERGRQSARGCVLLTESGRLCLTLSTLQRLILPRTRFGEGLVATPRGRVSGGPALLRLPPAYSAVDRAPDRGRYG